MILKTLLAWMIEGSDEMSLLIKSDHERYRDGFFGEEEQTLCDIDCRLGLSLYRNLRHIHVR